MLDKYVPFNKTNLPAKRRDDSGVTKNASQALQVFSLNLHRLMEKNPAATKAAMGTAADCDPKTITRILAKTNEPSLDKVTGLAKYFQIEPWQLLHPDLGVETLTLEHALHALADVLNTLPGDERKLAADALGILAHAPDSPKARQEFLSVVEKSKAPAEPSAASASIPADKQAEARKRREEALKNVEREPTKKRRSA